MVPSTAVQPSVRSTFLPSQGRVGFGGQRPRFLGACEECEEGKESDLAMHVDQGTERLLVDTT